MEAIRELTSRVQSLSVNALMSAMVKDNRFVAFILDINTQDQLFEKGIDSDGKKLRSAFGRFGEVYAPFTIMVKEAMGQPTDRVTLKDEGDFYHSFRLVLTSDHDIEITADTIKESGNLVEIWGPILGLTDENLDRVIEYAKEFIIIPFIRKHIFNG